MFTTSKNISVSEQQITWEQFKTYFDTTNWPEVLQVVNDGYFPDDIFGDVCDFCMRGYNKLMQNSNWTTVEIEHNQN